MHEPYRVSMGNEAFARFVAIADAGEGVDVHAEMRAVLILLFEEHGVPLVANAIGIFAQSVSPQSVLTYFDTMPVADRLDRLMDMAFGPR